MSENWSMQVSPRLADGTLINLRAETPGQLENMLGWVKEHAQEITEVSALLNATSNAANAGLTVPRANIEQPAQRPPAGYVPPQNVSTPAQGWGQPAQQGPDGPPPSCMHGEWKWVPPGNAKSTGKPYKGFYACPAPRGQQCKAA